MCGIAGWINLYANIEKDDRILFKMTDTLKKRDRISLLGTPLNQLLAI